MVLLKVDWSRRQVVLHIDLDRQTEILFSPFEEEDDAEYHKDDIRGSIDGEPQVV